MLANKLIKEEDIKNKIIAKLKCLVYRSGCKRLWCKTPKFKKKLIKFL